MTRWYLDTSAAWKLVVSEPESVALGSMIEDSQPDLVACWLLETEMRRAQQRDTAVTAMQVSDVLAAVSLYEAPPSLFREAGALPGDLRSLDALHLAAAMRIGVEKVLTYDARMVRAAGLLGLAAASPTRVMGPASATMRP